jgi:hypothetical protein
MDELIGQLAPEAGIDGVMAEETIGIALGFLRNDNAGFSRSKGCGLMAIGSRLMALGLGMSEIQGVARELFRFGRDKIGADQMGEIISGAPGLSQFA